MPKQKDPTTALGELVRSERLRLKWTQEDLADKAKIPRQAVTDMEVGPETRKVDIARVKAVARAMEQPVLRFLAVASPGEIEGELADTDGLSMDEHDLIQAIRRLPRTERRRVRAFVRMTEDMLGAEGL